MDPISVRRAKSSSTLNKTPTPKSPSTPKLKLSSKWVPFSQRDSAALEKAYQVNTYKQIKKNCCRYVNAFFFISLES